MASEVVAAAVVEVDGGAGLGEEELQVVTVRCPTNIAVIKYWGKRDEKLVLPLNSSLSVTLDPGRLAATTSATASASFSSDRIWLAGSGELDMAAHPRHRACLDALRARAGRPDLKFHVASSNSFPTAAGLASSAAGLAGLVYCVAQLLGVAGDHNNDSNDQNHRLPLSAIARMGSGSACRSLYGGFVRWDVGVAADGGDSIAVQVADEHHWPDLRVLICVVSDRRKDTSSSDGMRRSVQTSPLLAHRAKHIVPERMAAMEQAIQNRDFTSFGSLTAADSNQFHATCLDTAPPIFYLNDTSRQVIELVEQLNKDKHRITAIYTFDAGPNAVLFALEQDMPELLHRVLETFPPSEGTTVSKYVGDDALLQQAEAVQDKWQPRERHLGALRYLISTRVGEGPSITADEATALLDRRTGLPKSI
eukprot:jgi/Chlat1/6055/Chrsp4S06214